jgi:multiple antibiotic resistance protein
MGLSSRPSARQGFHKIDDYLGVLTALVIVELESWLVLRAAEKMQQMLGVTGMIAMARLMGFLMVCIGVQFLIDGLSAILRDPTFWSGLADAVRQT